MNRSTIHNDFLGGFKVALVFIVVFVIPATLTAGGKFKVLSFTKIGNDISAIMLEYKRLDVNDDICAIIKVRSDISNLHFTASNPIVGNVEFINGEYWIYLSPGTRQLSIFKEGYIKTSYTFPVHIESKTVYSMAVTAETAGYEKGKGSLFITSNPLQAEVRIDGFPDLVKTTPCKFENYRKGVYKFIITKQRYKTLDTIIKIDKGITKEISLKLTPLWGNLKVIMNDNKAATISFQGKTYTTDSLDLSGVLNGVDIGKYLLKISRENYYDTSFFVTINPGSTYSFQISLKPIKQLLTINSIPQGAKIYIDGIYSGITPFSGNIITGKHTVTLTLDNYVDETKEINIPKNNPFNLDVSLQNKVKVTIKSTPSEANVYINNEIAGKTPVTLKIPVGKNRLKLTKNHYQHFEKEIETKNEQVFSYKLEKEKYLLKIKSIPAGAKVTIDDVEKGTTPLEITQDYGSYDVRVGKSKYGIKRKHVDLLSDKTVTVKLKPTLGGYIGLSFLGSNDYEIVKLGCELGWGYRYAPHLMSAIGYLHGGVDLNEDEDFASIKGINPYDYEKLNLSFVDKDGFLEENVNSFYSRLGIVTFKTTFVFSALAAIYSYRGYYVYVADKDYFSNNGVATFLFEGDKFYDVNAKIKNTVFKYGVGIMLNLGQYYFSLDYWFKNENDIIDYPQYLIGVGIMLNNI